MERSSGSLRAFGGWATPCLLLSTWPSLSPRTPHGPHRSTGDVFQKLSCCPGPQGPPSVPSPAPPTSYGKVLPWLLGQPPWDWGCIPVPFPDLRQQLAEFRKMLKKRWVWACPGGWRPPWCPSLLLLHELGSALTSTQSPGRELAGGSLRAGGRKEFWVSRF